MKKTGITKKLWVQGTLVARREEYGRKGYRLWKKELHERRSVKQIFYLVDDAFARGVHFLPTDFGVLNEQFALFL